MPITKSAIKKLRRDHRVAKANKKIRDAVREAVKSFRKNPSLELLQKTTSILDRAAKKHILHKNKASRLKSRLSKQIKRS